MNVTKKLREIPLLPSGFLSSAGNVAIILPGGYRWELIILLYPVLFAIAAAL